MEHVWEHVIKTDVASMPSNKKSKKLHCDRCADANSIKNAKYKCLQCRDRLCSECTENHMILRPCLDFRIVELRTGKAVDSVFSLQPDDKSEIKENKIMRVDFDKPESDDAINKSESRYQVKRIFGKPVAQISLTKSNSIQIPVTPSSHRSGGSNTSFPSENSDGRWQKVDIGWESETKVPLSVEYSKAPKATKPSILKRTTSFKNDIQDNLLSSETLIRNSQMEHLRLLQKSSLQPSKKEVRFNTSMNSVPTDPKPPTGILREYSNNFYYIMEKQNSQKSAEPRPKSKPLPKKPKRNADNGLAMVSQSSIVIGEKEVAGKISSAMFLNDIYLVIVDRVNHKMKVFDSNDRYVIVIDKSIPKGSWGLTSPEDNIIALTCRNKIIFYGLFQIKTPRYEKGHEPVVQPLNVEYKLRASCYGISFCESRDLFFVACNVFFSDPSIFIVDTKGYTQQIIRYIDDGISPTIPFSETLKVDSDRGVLYIGDRIGKRIVCATYEGKHIWSVPLSGKPVSFACDQDNIYACVNGKNISVIHKDGRFVKNIIHLDLDGRRICYQESSNQIIVLTKAFWGVSHFIQMYQI